MSQYDPFFPKLSEDSIDKAIGQARQDKSLTGEQIGQELNRLYELQVRHFGSKEKKNSFERRQKGQNL